MYVGFFSKGFINEKIVVFVLLSTLIQLSFQKNKKK